MSIKVTEYPTVLLAIINNAHIAYIVFVNIGLFNSIIVYELILLCLFCKKNIYHKNIQIWATHSLNSLPNKYTCFFSFLSIVSHSATRWRFKIVEMWTFCFARGTSRITVCENVWKCESCHITGPELCIMVAN